MFALFVRSTRPCTHGSLMIAGAAHELLQSVELYI